MTTARTREQRNCGQAILDGQHRAVYTGRADLAAFLLSLDEDYE